VRKHPAVFYNPDDEGTQSDKIDAGRTAVLPGQNDGRVEVLLRPNFPEFTQS
jgi:hypothetical protein